MSYNSGLCKVNWQVTTPIPTHPRPRSRGLHLKIMSSSRFGFRLRTVIVAGATSNRKWFRGVSIYVGSGKIEKSVFTGVEAWLPQGVCSGVSVA